MITRFQHPRIYTGAPPPSPGRPPAFVTSLAVSDDGRLVDPSSNDASGRPPRGPVERLPGAAVVPGLIDTHAHLTSLGGGTRDLDLRDVESVEALLDRVREAAREADEDAWIRGTGWSDHDWPDGDPPDADTLDRAAGGRPVALFRRDRHAMLASGAALRAAGIARETVDPPGGFVVRGAGGEPLGPLLDTAMDAVIAVIPAMSTEALAREAALKSRHLASFGVTCVHEAWVEPELWAALDQLARAGGLSLRVRALLGHSWQSPPTSQDPLWLRAIAFKGFADGALGSRGAQLREPYSDACDTAGLAVETDAALRTLAERARAHGLQLAVHAIGDRAVTRVLDLFERVDAHLARVEGSTRALRWRIEHAQIVHPDDLVRLPGRCLATQPVHGLADGVWVADRLGERRRAWAYRARTLLEAGAVIGFGSDFPIESGDPRLGLDFLGAIAHPDVPDWDRRAERLERYASLDGYWSRAAYLAFDERQMGRLLPGYLADFVCLDGDPFAVTSPRSIEVVATYVGGRRVFSGQ